MSNTSSGSLLNSTYKKADQVFEKYKNKDITNWETSNTRTAQVIQTGANIHMCIVPDPPRLRKDQRRTD